MTPRLPGLLTSVDLPDAELQAARIDGDLFRIGSGFASVDEIESPIHRAHAAHAGLSHRLIAERLTAAWIWGALDHAPVPHEFCLAAGARANTVGMPGVVVREVVLGGSDPVDVGGVPVTSPLRTAIDLARTSPEFELRESDAVSRLMARFGFGPAECIYDMRARRNLPGKHRAAERLSRVEAISPS
jgi:hypothetical protein